MRKPRREASRRGFRILYELVYRIVEFLQLRGICRSAGYAMLNMIFQYYLCRVVQRRSDCR